ncbi:HPP family-domain-containing protein [Mucor mucedo]|uniref:HPP family-domain-containing protein n=1 Tax=Mucor mucedo TaxID=29922 RepID=UPI00222050D7|nr:HPP family-domain-containing protein [Mucor mucedo]KAI7886406.1 HPP family-domain-containing protein [Mucor mucedo]
MIIASFGASAILIYGVLDSPLAQPRNVICGQLIGSIVGVIIAQLFLNIQHVWASEEQKVVVEWLGGATAMALALTVMQITKTVHPPGGATALIAVITPNIVEMAWFYIAIVFLSSVLQVLVGCLVNNVERRYPQYWWTPHTPIRIDPATISTLIPNADTDSRRKEEVVSNNLTAAEEGRICSGDISIRRLSVVSSSANSSSTAMSIDNSVENAIKILQEHAQKSNISYTLISPGLPLITTSGILTDEQYQFMTILAQDVSLEPKKI